MSEIIVKKISRGEYEEYWGKSSKKNFLNEAEMVEMGGEVVYLGIFMGEEKIGAGAFRKRKNRVGMVDFYAPRGVLLEYEKLDERILCDIGEEMKKAVRREGGAKMTLEPLVVAQERNRSGEIVENGVDNRWVSRALERAGFLKIPYKHGISQITWQYVMPLTEMSEEKILEGMKGNTRRRLKQALTLGMRVKELNRGEVGEFCKIMDATAERKNFSARDEEYFLKIYDGLVEQGKAVFVAVVMNPKETYDRLCDIRKETEASETRTKREEQDKRDALVSLEARLTRLVGLFSGKLEDREVMLSAGLFMTSGDEILHLFGGNDGKYIKLDAQYVLQWEMIRRALREGRARYNFYGISENVDVEPDGVFEFKKGFPGVVEELIGEYQAPVNGVGKLWMRK